MSSQRVNGRAFRLSDHHQGPYYEIQLLA